MSYNTTTQGTTHIQELLRRVLATGKSIDVVFDTKEQATKFRFNCYSVRKKDRQAVAEFHKIPLGKAQSDYDKITLTIHKLEDGQWSVRLNIVDISMFNLRDPETGATINIDELAPKGVELGDDWGADDDGL